MAMTLRLTDEQRTALDARAKAEHRSMQQVISTAVDEYLARAEHGDRDDRVREVSRRYADRYADLLKRLGE